MRSCDFKAEGAEEIAGMGWDAGLRCKEGLFISQVIEFLEIL